ncbi:hypothetical protein BAE44_0000317 [Dichanthelium oligosanthes]|uniref:F-box domain-containing protein n=1 Tax=Dichanthelium oligosanthes TaxID=888268 RepID=A0A1E5WMR1_9POAL|nr:hypothetical protein BAE44_0000317 [Dichanthelium oligosanthes]
MWLYVYSSDAGSWSVQTCVAPTTACSVDREPAALVGNALYFPIGVGSSAVRYDLATRETSVMRLPPESWGYAAVLVAMEDGGLGVARLEGGVTGGLSLWKMEAGANGDIGWTQTTVVELGNLLALPISSRFLGFAHGTGVFVEADGGLFSFDLESGLVEMVCEGNSFHSVVPYTSFYTPELRWIDTAELLRLKSSGWSSSGSLAEKRRVGDAVGFQHNAFCQISHLLIRCLFGPTCQSPRSEHGKRNPTKVDQGVAPAKPNPSGPAPRRRRMAPALLDEVLLRLPPDEPWSLVRAALVCKRWRGLVLDDPGLRRRRRDLHATAAPPMLGFTCNLGSASEFVPASTSCAPRALRRGWRSTAASSSCRRGGTPSTPPSSSGTRSPTSGRSSPSCPATPAPTTRAGTPRCSAHPAAPTQAAPAVADPSSSCWWAAAARRRPRTPTHRRRTRGANGPTATDLAASSTYFLCRYIKGILRYNLETREMSVISLPDECNCKRIVLMATEDGRLGFQSLPVLGCGWSQWKV